MAIELNLESTRMPREQLDQFTRTLSAALDESGDMHAELGREEVQDGDRGAAAIVGTILIDSLKSSAFGEVIKILGAYLTREKSVSVTINHPDGGSVVVSAKNIRQSEVQAALETVLKSGSGA